MTSTPPHRYVDVHCHLTAEGYEGGLTEVISGAEAVGVDLMLTQAEGPDDCRRVLELARRHPTILPFLGQHPDAPDREEAAEVVGLIRENLDLVAGIGEIGLDFWKVKDHQERDVQIEIFADFVRLGRELDLPLSVHSRSAGRRALELLRELDAQRVCLHAFDGKASYARQGVEAGFWFSVPTSVLYSQQKRKLVRALPLEHLLLETDSPVLGPDREQRNEPANLPIAAREVAAIKGEDLETVARAALSNTRAFLGPQWPGLQ